MSAALSEPPGPVFDAISLNRDLDRTKTAVFLGKTAAFLGSLMCSMEFIWQEEIETAATDGQHIWWSPSYYLGLPPASRKTDLMHELWHTGFMHGVRRGERDPKIWNIACDIKIDLLLQEEKYSFEKIEGVLSWPWLNAQQYIGWVEEDIYDDLFKKATPIPQNYKPDLRQGNTAKTLNNVVRAMVEHKLAKNAGLLPGNIEKMLEKFLTPIIPWEKHLHRFMHELVDGGFTWKRPNRRYPDFYLPSHEMEEGALDKLFFYEDVSGSISDADSLRFNSEIKHVKDVYDPKELVVIQFDTRISYEKTFQQEDRFEKIPIIGGGGTCLIPVREHIIKHRPTAVIIFSDMCVAPMEPLPFSVPTLWVAISNREATVPFGELIHIR